MTATDGKHRFIPSRGHTRSYRCRGERYQADGTDDASCLAINRVKPNNT